MIRKTLAAALTTIALLNIAACTTTEGVKPDANISTSFVKGVSTVTDVEARLGQPLKTVTNPDGTSTVTFHYGEAHITAMALVGSVSGEDIITVVNFDRRGKYLSLTQESNNRKTGI